MATLPEPGVAVAKPTESSTSSVLTTARKWVKDLLVQAVKIQNPTAKVPLSCLVLVV